MRRVPRRRFARRPFAGQPVDHHRHTIIARIVDEQLFAGRMQLAHRH
jgi:hypothetical protein